MKKLFFLLLALSSCTHAYDYEEYNIDDYFFYGVSIGDLIECSDKVEVNYMGFQYFVEIDSLMFCFDMRGYPKKEKWFINSKEQDINLFEDKLLEIFTTFT